jgi:hypothetical protein
MAGLQEVKASYLPRHPSLSDLRRQICLVQAHWFKQKLRPNSPTSQRCQTLNLLPEVLILHSYLAPLTRRRHRIHFYFLLSLHYSFSVLLLLTPILQEGQHLCYQLTSLLRYLDS